MEEIEKRSKQLEGENEQLEDENQCLKDEIQLLKDQLGSSRAQNATLKTNYQHIEELYHDKQLQVGWLLEQNLELQARCERDKPRNGFQSILLWWFVAAAQGKSFPSLLGAGKAIFRAAVILVYCTRTASQYYALTCSA